MNPTKIFTSIIILTNRLIDSLNYKTVETIKRSFFFFIFVMCIIGIIIGYRIGSGEAKIKKTPLAEYVNDTFRLDINKGDGDFSEILKNEMLNEAPMNNFNKYDFPLRENFNPEFKKGIMESDSKIPDPDLSDKPFKPETPIDDYSSKFDQQKNDQSIKILDKQKSDDTKIDDNKSSSIFNDDQPFNKTEIKNPDDKNIIRILDKDKDKNTIPQPIKKDTGIIDK
ncbi:MAG: hypothetical protein FWF73_05280 [Spirochaetes bacterium]|nr:hypothetical protein [Spirochaetota bacterium]